jgi:hypothetical protein
MTKPVLVSHQGKLAHLHEDGTLTNPDGSPVVDKIDKHRPPPAKRWHDPYP